jgi:two-component system response regulator AtoC
MTHALHILIVDDEDIVHTTIGDYLRDVGHQVEGAHDGMKALELLNAHDYDLALVDIRMPRMDGITLLGEIQQIHPDLSVIMITAHGKMETVIQALRLGAVDFLTKPVKFLELDAVIEKALRVRQLRQGQRHLRETIRGLQASEYLRADNRRLVGMSPALQQIREFITHAVDAAVDTILITGETGTGKEVVARAIHFQTHSDEAPFIAVNCPAIPETLIESELFGHMKGSFTGATTDQAGYFELADGGTLFLDEIGDLSAAAQAKILRVLETRTLRRIGGKKEKHVNVRVIAATNVPLEHHVEAGTFRRDLFYRLNLFPIHVPPLRDRPEDIRPLAEHFLSIYSRKSGRPFTGFAPEVFDTLARYDFPGNARELQNIIERAAIICKEGHIQPEHIIIQSSSLTSQPVLPQKSKEDSEREAILQALEETHWNRRKAAKKLGMPYSTLRFKMTQLKIS